MSKRQYDHIENKIREAAENSEPAFEEQAWDKMEAKLNAEKERRRSPFLWFSLALLSFGLLGGIIILHNRAAKNLSIAANSLPTVNTNKDEALTASTVNKTIIQTTNSNNKSLAASDKEVNKSNNIDQRNVGQKNGQSSVKNNSASNVTSIGSANALTKQNKQSVLATEKETNAADNIVGANLSSSYHNSAKKENITVVNNDNTTALSKTSGKKYSKRNSKINNEFVSPNNSVSYSFAQKNKRNISGNTRTKIKTADQADDSAFSKEIDEAVNNTNNKKAQLPIDRDKKKDSVQKLIPKDTIAVRSAKKEIKKESTQKKTPWYLLASIGADASNVTLFSFNNSSITPRYGVGIGYQINKRISVQTGFYAGRKKYVAGPGDYHSKDESYLNNVNVTKISANCTIFEIPIAVRYNFALRPKTTYYATAGISSFIMNKEDYDYSYTAYNNNYQASNSYTGNKNLFSIATLSVGVERKISKAFSIQAEPSVNIPIAGVGEGTVKLYSTDIQVGVKYNFHW